MPTIRTPGCPRSRQLGRALSPMIHGAATAGHFSLPKDNEWEDVWRHGAQNKLGQSLTRLAPFCSLRADMWATTSRVSTLEDQV
eukprot:2104577-Rhodomonas_salina.1